MPKNKPCKGLLKRVRFTKTGRIRRSRAGGRHLRSHKSGKLLRSYRGSAFLTGPEAKRVRAMLFTRAQTSETRPSEEGAAQDQGA